MFTKSELQIIGQTLIQRKDWLEKNMHKPELAKSLAQNQKMLGIIESSIQKISQLIRDQNPQNGKDVTHYISTPAASPIRQAALNRRQELEPGDIKALIVDDDQLMCDLLTAYLRYAGIRMIDVAQNGMVGISMMYEANPIYDLVLCDWNMPTKSGIDVHNAMRAAERYINAVFMLVTAVTEAKQIKAAIDEGVDDYIAKPVEQEKLVKKIARFFPKVTSSSAD
jgi:two-component system chemotaxis response regulator CheY